jgi:RNA polymerase sigma-70 factor (ECF subfamily)
LDEDEAWLEGLLRSYRAQVVRMLARYVIDRDAVEDLAQRTFIEAWRKRRERPERELPWLYGVARNLARGQWRADQRGEAALRKLSVDLSVDPTIHDGGIGYSELVYDIAEACKTLTANERECLLLAVQDGLTDHEIAEILKISSSNVRQLRHRARAKLQVALAAESRSARSKG